MLDLDDLTMSLAGLRDDPFTCGPGDLERIVQASASAGFRGVSLWSIHADQLAANDPQQNLLVDAVDQRLFRGGTRGGIGIDDRFGRLFSGSGRVFLTVDNHEALV